jgi:prephenate dehydratase/chorismate mutase/prephenate dehydratase
MSESQETARSSLDEVRGRIDEIDRRILLDLQERLELSLQTRRLKSLPRDPEREKNLLERLERESRARGLLSPEFVSGVFERIIGESLALQEKAAGLIGFQGEHGAYSEEAARRWDKDLIPIPCREFVDVVRGVENGCLDLGIVPVQNSLGGSLSRVNRLLLDTGLKAIGEVILPVRHCLLALPDADFREIREVYSHPQALDQCREYLERHGLIPRACEDTAGAARRLVSERLKNAAAVAGRDCARLYQLEVIQENIQDRPHNFTRFLVLGRGERREDTDKCSLIFTVPHAPGSLFGVLQVFARRGLNLTRIESIPDRDDPGRTAFFCDFQTAGEWERLDEVLSELEEKTLRVTLLGCYREDK